jgi:glycosyltransferase involved in cell wall biosynthesis
VSRPVVYFSPIPWRGLVQRPQHCCRLLALDRPVLAVEPAVLHTRPPADADGIHHLALPVFPTNARNPELRGLARLAAGLPGAQALLRAAQARRLRRRLRELDLERPLLLFGHPEFAALRAGFPGAPVVYDHMDDILRFGDPPRRLREELAGLVRDAALVTATSERLLEQVRAMGARRALRVGNGVEWERFALAAPPPEPAALSPLPRPRAVYAGSVAEWFDFPLLFDIARRAPEASFPVVGPLRPALEAVAAEAPPNVRFLGPVPYAELPAWLAHCQAALIPFLRTPLTEAVDPVKVHEYLAAGLPVVSTPFSAEMEALAGPVALAADAAGFAAALAEALGNPPEPAAQRAAAEPRRWERQLAPLREAVAALD